MMSAAFGLGFVLGRRLAECSVTSIRALPFWVAAGFSLLNYLYGLLVLPESLPVERRERFSWRRANPVGSITLLRSHRELLGLAFVNFISSIAHEALPTTFVLYAMYRYRWNERTVGLAIAAVGVCSAIVGAGLVEPFVARLGERRVMLLGLVFGIAGFTVYGLASTGAIFWMALPINAMWGLSSPPMQGMMTRRVSPSEQGQLQGALSSLRGVAFMIGPILFTSVFASFIGANREWHLPGAPYLLAAMLLVAAMYVAWRATRPRMSESEPAFASVAADSIN